MSYKTLKTYQTATIIYDFTCDFCNQYVKPDKSYQSDRSYRSYRTADQMVQAARSGKQNIVEGSTERTSKKSELKLLGVARASFQELLEDFEDFLRQRGLSQWRKDSAQADAVRRLAYKTDKSYRTYKSYLTDSTDAANAAICIINQENFLLDRQIHSLEEKFVKIGGWTEGMRSQRERERKEQIRRNSPW